MIIYTHDHLHLMSADPGAAGEFYKEMFQARAIAVRSDGRVDLELGGQMLFISPSSRNAQSDMSNGGVIDHFALSVNDLDQAVRELKGKGATFTKEPVTVRQGVRVAFVRGPDSIDIELLQRG